jgi:hypothetical protein
MTGLAPLLASPSGGLRRGWLMRVQLKSRMTKCRLATVIFYFVTFVCTDRIVNFGAHSSIILSTFMKYPLLLVATLYGK